MKNLIDCIEELSASTPAASAGANATPANVIGMGNPMLPDADTVGSEGVPTAKPRRKRKKREITRQDEDLKFPLAKFLSELLYTLRGFRVAMMAEENDIVLRLRNGKEVGRFSRVLTDRSISDLIVGL